MCVCVCVCVLNMRMCICICACVYTSVCMTYVIPVGVIRLVAMATRNSEVMEIITTIATSSPRDKV